MIILDDSHIGNFFPFLSSSVSLYVCPSFLLSSPSFLLLSPFPTIQPFLAHCIFLFISPFFLSPSTLPLPSSLPSLPSLPPFPPFLPSLPSYLPSLPSFFLSLLPCTAIFLKCYILLTVFWCSHHHHSGGNSRGLLSLERTYIYRLQDIKEWFHLIKSNPCPRYYSVYKNKQL